MIWFISTLVAISLLISINTALSLIYSLQLTAAHALRFSVFTSRFLATDLNTETRTSTHYEVFLLYFGFNHSVLLCPNLYSINLHNSLRTRSNLDLVLSTAEPSWTLFRDGYVSLTHGLTSMTACKRPSLFPINLPHRPHRKHLLL
jgi:hypothetical protein